ncbi:MAG: hypothetical protein ACT4QA_18335 [Panacagrimonas sp.]
MAAKKYLSFLAGRTKEVTATVVSAGAANDGDLPALDSTGRLDTSVMPVGIGADTASIVASEALSAGDFVNVFDNAGSIRVRKADATTEGKEADGFVLEAVASAATATVYFEGSNTQRSGLTLGAFYYLGTTAGGVTTTAPTATGNVAMLVGRAISATTISFEPSAPVTRA